MRKIGIKILEGRRLNKSKILILAPLVLFVSFMIQKLLSVKRMDKIKLIIVLFIVALSITSFVYAYGDKGTPCLDCHTVFATTVLVSVSPTEVTAKAGDSVEFYATVTGSGYHKGYTQSAIAVPIGWIGGGDYIGYTKGTFLDGTPADNYYTELRSDPDHYEEFHGMVTIPSDAPEGDYMVEVWGAGCDENGAKASDMKTIIVHVTFPGDIDGDGDVDSDDLYIFAGAYGSSIGDPAYEPEADLDDDGDVDAYDLYIFARNYGKPSYSHLKLFKRRLGSSNR